jgi:hypothetical protein
MKQTDDHLAIGLYFFGAAIRVGDPVKGLLWWRNVVARRRKDDDRRANGRVDDAQRRPDFSPSQPATNEEIVDNQRSASFMRSSCPRSARIRVRRLGADVENRWCALAQKVSAGLSSRS